MRDKFKLGVRSIGPSIYVSLACTRKRRPKEEGIILNWHIVIYKGWETRVRLITTSRNRETWCTHTYDIQKRGRYSNSSYVAQCAFESGKKSRPRKEEDETSDRMCDREAYALV